MLKVLVVASFLICFFTSLTLGAPNTLSTRYFGIPPFSTGHIHAPAQLGKPSPLNSSIPRERDNFKLRHEFRMEADALKFFLSLPPEVKADILRVFKPILGKVSYRQLLTLYFYRLNSCLGENLQHTQSQEDVVLPAQTSRKISQEINNPSNAQEVTEKFPSQSAVGVEYTSEKDINPPEQRSQKVSRKFTEICPFEKPAETNVVKSCTGFSQIDFDNILAIDVPLYLTYTLLARRVPVWWGGYKSQKFPFPPEKEIKICFTKEDFFPLLHRQNIFGIKSPTKAISASLVTCNFQDNILPQRIRSPPKPL